MKSYLKQSKDRIQSSLRSEFNRNILILTSGTAIAQAIPILITPILTRLYTPADFGALAVFVSIVSIVSVISCGRYELAIMLPEKDEDAINVAAVAFIFNLFVSILFLIFLLFLGDWFLRLLKAEVLKGWIYFAPLTVFMMGIFNILNYTNNRFKLYKDIARANVYKSLTMAIIQLILGVLKAGYIGLITGQILAQFVANLKLFKNITLLYKFINKKEIINKAKIYSSFPLISSLGAVLDNLTTSLPYLMVPKMFGIVYSGYFFFSLKLLLVPISLISSNVGQVLLKELSFYKNKDLKILKILYIKSFLKLLFISSSFSILIFLSTFFLWGSVFGEKWNECRDLVMYLIPAAFLRMIASPLSVIFIAMEKLSLSTFWQSLYFISSSVVIMVTFMLSLSFHIFIILFTLNEVIIYILYLILSFKVVNSIRGG
ncbi:MAG: oligosaccharide flippase family protein [Hydrogenothermaceae bacterium]|nr:oligosaccharide flippase family protein [Hydrogenothermaceae bacterium]